MRRVILLCGLAIGLVAGWFPRGSQSDVDAGTAVCLDIDGLVDEAEFVFEGYTRSATVVESSPRRIETELVIDVDRWFVGEGPSRITVRVPGGVLPDGSGLMLPGMPRIRQGEDVLLFLSEAGDTGVRVPVGLSQGKFRVETRLDGLRALSRRHGSLTTIDPSTGSTEDAGGAEVFDYAETIAKIYAAAERKETRR